MEKHLEIDFKRDLRNVLSLPLSIILRYGFVFGLLAAIGGAMMGIPEILLEQLLRFLNTGEVDLRRARHFFSSYYVYSNRRSCRLRHHIFVSCIFASSR